MNWIGVALPLGKVTCEQMRGLAKIAQDLGDGDIRLTVWQNLLIPGVRDENVGLAVAAIEAIGLKVKTSPISAGLIACTGNAGCKFSASDTKRHAAAIGDWCEPRVPIDSPLNIHLTGCHHSCAQHYISDIGLIGAIVPVGEDDDTVEGYHLFAGGGFGPNADVGQEVYHDLKAEDAPKTVEKLLKAYLAHRASPDETFLTLRAPPRWRDTAQARRRRGFLMNQMTPPPKIEIIPSSAPFSEAQRSWLNGFFAGLLSTDASGAAVARAGRGRTSGCGGDGDDDEAPWHDQTLPIAERMKLAEGRPLRRRMMAAMAQQDCGQCGYNCNDYSDAIASRAEARLNLCVPGGKETARMLKALNEELEKAPAASPGAWSAGRHCGADHGGAGAFARQSGRRDIRLAPPLEQDRIGKGNLAHRFRPSGCGLDYVVGDSFGIFARNELGLVDQIIAMLGASHMTEIRGKTLREVLADDVSLAPAPDFAVRTTLVHHRRRSAREGARAGARRGPRRRRRDARRDGGPAKILRRASASRSLRRSAGAAAAPALFDLFVAQCDAWETVADGRLRALCRRQAQALGLASTFLAERIKPGDQVKVYVQKAHGFALPRIPKRRSS